MPCDAVVTGVDRLAKHKVAGSTPVTRSFFARVAGSVKAGAAG